MPFGTGGLQLTSERIELLQDVRRRKLEAGPIWPRRLHELRLNRFYKLAMRVNF